MRNDHMPALFLLAVLSAATVHGQSPAVGQSSGAKAEFAVTSVKPAPAERGGQLLLDYCRTDGSFAVAGAPLIWSLAYAFEQPEYAIAGVPDWLTRFATYDIEAKPEAAVDNGQCRAMLRTLFAERFQLATHQEKRPAAVYFLREDPKGSKLRPGGGVHLNSSVQVDAHGAQQWPDGWTMAELAVHLSDWLSRPVIDDTGLSGKFGITLDYSRSENDGRPDLITAVREQLGLRLVPGKAPVEMLVIDGIRKPDPN
ncbi:TIGR03435 family protein [Silvibacterium sp.]|uniref:TIGR03435 family protein n=1 Tax=Silvibacterium sp. TaxID=1964179 RepID=UPI0039E27DC3